jgi:hypothetical protein
MDPFLATMRGAWRRAALPRMMDYFLFAILSSAESLPEHLEKMVHPVL